MTLKEPDGPAVDDDPDDESDDLIHALFRDLEIQSPASEGDRALGLAFASLLKLPAPNLTKVGLDLAAYLGMGDDWTASLDVTLRSLEADEGNLTLKLWQLRCLVELDRFAEAVALVNAVRWSDRERIHVNYLAGRSFETLGLTEQARQRFDAVAKLDPHYRDVAQKIEPGR